MIAFSVIAVGSFLVGNDIAGNVDFVRDVEPILKKRCYVCHGPKKSEGGLRLDRKRDAERGGDSGQVISSKNSKQSLLMERIQAKAEDERMPPVGEPLSEKEINTIAVWIDAGADRPDDTEPTEVHWSFKPLNRPAVPAMTGAINPIDAFLLDRLRKDDLSFNAHADRIALLRRLSFNLRGLPPTMEEIDAFLADSAPNAYEKLVDRMLASPQFGERWARHWLDVARFAESDGFETNLARTNAWPYRDYVIRAFNDDRPYNRFVLEQLAGDVVGEEAATGFLVGGPVDRVKSPDPVLTAQQRADELHDMIVATGAAFMGVTVGCARCHGHKIDPIPQTDYYAIKACFEGVQHGERPYGEIDRSNRDAERAKLVDESAGLEIQLAALEPLAQPSAKSAQRSPVAALGNWERFPPTQAKYLRFTVLATNNLEPCIDELQVFSSEAKARNVALASLGTKARSSGDYPNSDIHRLEHINDNKFGNSRSWISNQVGGGWVELEFPSAVSISSIAWARDREGKFQDRLPTRYLIEVAEQPGKWRLVASNRDRAEPGQPDPTKNSAKRSKLLNARKQLAGKLAELSAVPMAYLGRFTPAPETRRMHRGDPMTLREQIAPGGLSIGTPFKLAADVPERERRRKLAEWIASKSNFLTWRVAANRIWQHHFGIGIVETSSDFGAAGTSPSHSDLLDWLAVELRDDPAHSQKRIHRMIVTSEAYRQSSAARSDGLAKDAGNRLLWRYPGRRLEAEAVRDAMLSAAGVLNPRMYGPGFDLFEPNSNYVKVYTPRTEFPSDTLRRMVYWSKPRTRLDDTFGVFDCPDAGQVSTRRNQSTTPIQALSLLNSPFAVRVSELFADRLKREETMPAAQIALAYRLVFSRPATAAELQDAAELVRNTDLSALCRALFNTHEFLEIP